MKSTRVSIECRCFDKGVPEPRMETVSAFRPDGCDILAVHEVAGAWRITHIPTGMCVPHTGYCWPTRAEALDAAARLESMVPPLKSLKMAKNGRTVANRKKALSECVPLMDAWRSTLYPG
jgi:protein subunit release factor A